jgi:hypothetical protein
MSCANAKVPGPTCGSPGSDRFGDLSNGRVRWLLQDADFKQSPAFVDVDLAAIDHEAALIERAFAA